ncbi:unnamed protein product, partial [Hapterophycus canaliculatus]
SPTRNKGGRSSVVFGGGGGGGGGGMAAPPKENGRRRSRRDIPQADFVVSTEFLHRRRGQTTILVISNLRVLCVKASLRGGGSGASSGMGGMSAGGMTGGGDGSGGNGGGGGGAGSGGGGSGGGGLRGSAITGLELQWQIELESLTGLPALLDEDGGGTTLDFTYVVGAGTSGSGRRRDGKTGLRGSLHRGRMAGIAAVLGNNDG